MAEDSKQPGASVRAWLRDALSDWQREGLVSADAATTLRERYQLDAPGRSAGHILSVVILSLGGLLLGGGIMALVAANWQEIPATMKVVGMFALLLGLHFSGFRALRKGQRALGHGLILAACVCFGGGIGLMAQVFQISSEIGAGVLLWAIGALAVAYAVPTLPSALLALALTFYWFLADGTSVREYPIWSTVATPFLTLALYCGLARMMKSRFLASAGAFISALFFGFAAYSLADAVSLWACGAAVGGLLGWAVGAALAARGCDVSAADGMRSGAAAAMGVAAYVACFHWLYEHSGSGYYGYRHLSSQPAAIVCVVLALIIAVAVLAMAWSRERPKGSHRIVVQCIFVGVGCLLVVGLISLAIQDAGVLLTILANIGAIALAIGALASGFSEARRKHFWAGTVLLLLLVISRFFEYDTELVVKAMVLIGCGVLVMYGGIEYERFLARRAAAAKEVAGNVE